MDSKRAETQHVSRIVSIGGSKGGVGKSMTTMAALDYHLAEGTSVDLGRLRRCQPRCASRVPGPGTHRADQSSPPDGGRDSTDGCLARPFLSGVRTRTASRTY